MQFPLKKKGREDGRKEIKMKMRQRGKEGKEVGDIPSKKMEKRGENGERQRGHERSRKAGWRNNYHFFHHSFITVLCCHAQQASTALGPSLLMKYYYSRRHIRASTSLTLSPSERRKRCVAKQSGTKSLFSPSKTADLNSMAAGTRREGGAVRDVNSLY